MKQQQSSIVLSCCVVACASLWTVSTVNGFTVPTTPAVPSCRSTAFVQQPRSFVLPVLFSEVADAVEEPTAEVVEEDKVEEEAPVVAEEETVASSEEAEEPAAEEPAVEEPAVEEPAPERFTAYVNNLGFTTTAEALEEMCVAAGDVKNVSVPKRRGTDLTRGFAFVDFTSQEELEKAVATLNGADLDGRELVVTISVPKDELPAKPERTPVDSEERNERKIYVGNLPYGIDKDTLTAQFAAQAETEYVYIARDKEGKDRGFGFVTLKNVEDVDSTIAAIDGTEIDGRVLAARRPMETSEKASASNGTRIYFGNISFDTSVAQMKEIFEEHGNVLSIFISEDRDTGKSRGFGFAVMDPESADGAIAALDGLEVDGRPIRVTKAEERERSDRVRVYCGNLSWDRDADGVKALFEEYGPVLDMYYATSPMGTPRGFAIVTMSNEGSAAAIEALNGQEVDGRMLKVNEAKPKTKSIPRTKIYVGNLSFDTEEDTIREVFEEYGEVVECFLPQDREFGGSRGFGFVTMDSADAEAAIDELNGIDLDGRSIRVVEAEDKTRGGGRRERNDFDNNDDGGYENDGY